jgi:hypothetical protein
LRRDAQACNDAQLRKVEDGSLNHTENLVGCYYIEEIAKLLHLSIETIKIDTRKAKAFLKAGFQGTVSTPIQ